jgi:uncharacterized protein YbjT (DUF2867 family)
MKPMRVLVAGASGYVGSTLIPHLLERGHDVVAFGRDDGRVRAALDGHADAVRILRGELVSGEGLEPAMRGAGLAYYLVHSMERAVGATFAEHERRAAENFAKAARRAGVARIVYLGGPVPAAARASRHLASRLHVERVLLEAVPDSVALRASIIIGARSRSFRFLVRLVERLPVMALPAWRRNRTQPVDERDVIAFLLTAGASGRARGRSLDIAGPDVLTYGEMIERIAELMLVWRPALSLSFNVTPIAARIAAAVAGEDPDLILPLMEGLETDLLPRDDLAAELLGVHTHHFDAAVEHALRDWEAVEPLAAR